MRNKLHAFIATIMISHTGLTYGATYAQTAVVSATGGDYTTPTAALADLASWCGTPSATQRCLIKLLPGSYDIGNSTFKLSPYVSLIGSGRDVTTVTDSGADITIETSDHTELADLHIDTGMDLQGRITGVVGRGTGVYVHNISVNVPRPASSFTHGLDFFGLSNGAGLGGSAIAHDIEVTMDLSVSGDNYGIRSVNDLTLSDVSVKVNGGRISRGLLLSNKYALNNATIEMSPSTAGVRTIGLALSAPTALGLGTASNVHSFVQADNAGGQAWAVAVGGGHQTNKAYLNNINGRVRGGDSDSVGLYITDSTVHVANSQFQGDTAAVQTVNARPNSLLTTSTLLKSGVVNSSGAPLNCTAITDAAFGFHNNTCP